MEITLNMEDISMFYQFWLDFNAEIHQNVLYVQNDYSPKEF